MGRRALTDAGAIDLEALAGRTLPLLPRPVARAEFVAELRERLQGQARAVAVHRAGIVTELEAATVVAARGGAIRSSFHHPCGFATPS